MFKSWWPTLANFQVRPMLPKLDTVSDILHIPINVFKHTHDTERKKYKVFNENQESWISFRVITVLYTLYSFVAYLARIQYLIYQGKNVSSQMVLRICLYLIFDVSLLAMYWFIVYLRRNDKGHTLNARTALDEQQYDGTSLKVSLQNIFIIGITILLGLWLIMRVAEGQCKETISFNNFACNPNHDRAGLPTESVISVMLFPLAFCIAFRGTSFGIQIITWLISLIFIFTTTIYVNILPNIPYIIIYAPISLFLIYESERQNKLIFLIAGRLSELLEENERLADETHANELRHMLGNVAHDLRTPLTSFLNCMDLMGTTVEELHLHSKQRQAQGTATPTPTPAAIQQCTHSLNELLGSLRNATTFMAMAINRCLDFTKSSKGIALSANLEAVNLTRALELPMRVVNDMQSRIGISLLPLPPELCTFVVTDMQWLQENILCLLSNAVKYSTSGSVQISFTVHTSAELFSRDSEEIDSGVFTSARLRAAARLPLSKQANHYATLGSVRSFADAETEEGMGMAGGDNESVLVRDNSERSQKTVKIAFSEVTIQKTSSGVLFMSKSIGWGNRKYKYNTSSTSNSYHTGSSSSQQLQKQPEFLRCEVQDCGIGLAQDEMLTIFYPFRQTHRMNGGVGLGLFSLAKRVEALGGYYGVSAREDGQTGCRFFFGIPYIPDELSAQLRSKPPQTMMSFIRQDRVVMVGKSFLDLPVSPRESFKDRTNTSSSTNGVMPPDATAGPVLRILVVDDSLAILKMTSMILRRQGHLVETAMNGAEALDKLELARLKRSETAFELVLMDLQMPVMDGLEAIRRIRRNEIELQKDQQEQSDRQDWAEHSGVKSQIKHLNIIAMSANTDITSSSSAIQAGADRFIPKPFTMASLNQILEEMAQPAAPTTSLSAMHVLQHESSCSPV